MEKIRKDEFLYISERDNSLEMVIRICCNGTWENSRLDFKGLQGRQYPHSLGLD